MAKVRELIPGDQVILIGMPGVFVTRLNHPRYPGLQQVIWYLPLQGEYSFDALRPDQEIGQLVESTNEDRVRRLETFLQPRIGE